MRKTSVYLITGLFCAFVSEVMMARTLVRSSSSKSPGEATIRGRESTGLSTRAAERVTEAEFESRLGSGRIDAMAPHSMEGRTEVTTDSIEGMGQRRLSAEDTLSLHASAVASNSGSYNNLVSQTIEVYAKFESVTVVDVNSNSIGEMVLDVVRSDCLKCIVGIHDVLVDGTELATIEKNSTGMEVSRTWGLREGMIKNDIDPNRLNEKCREYAIAI